MSNKVYIVGVGMTKMGREIARPLNDFAAEAVNEAVTDAGLDLSKIEFAAFANNMKAILWREAVTTPGQVALWHMGQSGIPTVNVENGCTSSSSAFHLCVQAIRAGSVDFALAIGAEKTNHEDKQRMLESFAAAVDPDSWEDSVNELNRHVDSGEYGAGEGDRSAFMNIYGYIARAHMATFGTTQRQLAFIASKNHTHASMNDKCAYTQPMTVDEVLAGRAIDFPLTVPMCSPFTDGGAAVILASEAGLKRLQKARPIQVLASVLGSSTQRPWDDFENNITRRLSKKAYAESGLGPEDMHLAEVHDATAFGELLETEMLGFCPIGTGGAFAESGATSLGGRIPVNVSGGLESRGHPIGATGCAMIYEIVTQLRGEAGARQVKGAQNAIVENGGGFLGVEPAAAVVAILTNQLR